MQTKSSHNWATKSGTWDALKTEHVDFSEDYPVLNCTHLEDGIIVNCNDYKNINSMSIVSTFLDDYILERFWNNPLNYVEKFNEAKSVMSPDFSLLLGMPTPMQQWNVYRNRLVGHVWAKNGLNVIPTISWSDEKSFDFCFNGIYQNSIVAISNVGCNTDRQKEYFDRGFQQMKKIIKPRKMLFMCNKKYKEFYADENIVFIKTFWENKLK